MIINGKEFGVAYDQLTIVTICKELGLKYIDELSEVYKEAFGDTSRVSVEAVTLQYAIIYASLNRWCERNKKDYRLEKDEVVDLDAETLQNVLKEVFTFIAENTPQAKEAKKKKEVEPA